MNLIAKIDIALWFFLHVVVFLYTKYRVLPNERSKTDVIGNASLNRKAAAAALQGITDGKEGKEGKGKGKGNGKKKSGGRVKPVSESEISNASDIEDYSDVDSNAEEDDVDDIDNEASILTLDKFKRGTKGWGDRRNTTPPGDFPIQLLCFSWSWKYIGHGSIFTEVKDTCIGYGTH